METERFYIYLKGEITMKKNNIKEFLKDNWSNVIMAGAIVTVGTITTVIWTTLNKLDKS